MNEGRCGGLRGKKREARRKNEKRNEGKKENLKCMLSFIFQQDKMSPADF